MILFYLICCEIYRISFNNFSSVSLNSPKIVHIALGSNVGNRFELLQNALHKIYLEIGEVLQVSQIYETPAWGFEGNAFLNACIAVSTRFSAEEILRKLLKIEADAGRVRSDAKNYQNRSLDLDILLFEDEILETTDLIVPHPAMQNRKFVLLPLADIAAKENHPVFKISIEKLLKRVEDNSEKSLQFK